eukprot:scaffold473_cov132-Cylindrotheca_fusiformis.AAC.13
MIHFQDAPSHSISLLPSIGPYPVAPVFIHLIYADYMSGHGDHSKVEKVGHEFRQAAKQGQDANHSVQSNGATALFRQNPGHLNDWIRKE